MNTENMEQGRTTINEGGKAMKHTIRNYRHKGMVFGTVAVLALCGGMAFAEMQSGKIDLKKKDEPAKTQTQTQAQAQPDPFRDMLRLQRQVDQLFGDTLDPYIGFPDFDVAWSQQQWQPAMDLTEKPDAYTVQMELPGMDKSDINIEVKDRVLTVSGERKASTNKDNDKGKVLVQERSLSEFSRQVVLPKAVNADQVTAEYKNGVLNITLPKTEKDQEAQKIEIK